MRRFKSFLLILMALWLPLQAAAAVAMPFCRHAAEQPLQAAALQSPEHCHEHAGNAAGPEGGAGSSDLACDNCEMCHLASASYISSAAVVLPPPVASALIGKPALVARNHIAEPPRHPPRRLS